MDHSITRKESYLVNHKTSLVKSQDQRRREALSRQKQDRQNAFDQARSSSNLDMLEELNLMSDSESDNSDNSKSPSTSSTTTNSNSISSLTTKPSTSKSKKDSKKSRSNKPRFFPWAKDLLMYAETLDLEAGLLPPRLETDWSVVIAPKGKRVVVVSGFTTGANTVLLARASGRSLERRSTKLPPDCILDALYDRDINTIWVLDVIKWRGVYYIDFDFTFRSWFLSAKLSELPPQTYIPSSFRSSSSQNSRKAPLLVLPTPRDSSPLTPSTLLNIMSTVDIPTTIPISVLIPSSSSSSSGGILNPSIIQLPFSTTGYLIFLNSALYHSGPTTLTCWIPNEVMRGRDELEGLGRMKRLVEQWEIRGGKAREGDDMELDGEGLIELEGEEGEGEMDLSAE